MDMLKTQLIQRRHPYDIIQHIQTNYDDIVKDYESEFNDSRNDPFNTNPKRGPNINNFISTMRFTLYGDYELNGTLEFNPSLIFNNGNSSIKVDGISTDILKCHKKNIRLYRVTAAAIRILEGSVYFNHQIIQDKDIILQPKCDKYIIINSIDYEQSDITLKSTSAVLEFIQHIEYVPKKKCNKCKKINKQFSILYKDIIIKDASNVLR